MRNLIKSLSLAVALIAPVALHATPLTGQFSIDGTVTNTGTVLNFVPGTAAVGTGTQTGSFASLLTAGQLLTSGPATINYTPYVPGSAVFTVGSLTATLESLVATNFSLGGATITAFVGDALFTAAGFDTTAGTISFSTQGSGPVTFSATGLATASQVPEPSTLALFGTGALGLAGLVSRKLMA